jgi:hypothetical protein
MPKLLNNAARWAVSCAAEAYAATTIEHAHRTYPLAEPLKNAHPSTST